MGGSSGHLVRVAATESPHDEFDRRVDAMLVCPAGSRGIQLPNVT
jgi:hypothetical protein